jgi:hypothetical protein
LVCILKILRRKTSHEFIEANLNEEKLTEGIFAPWMMYKDEFLSIGGHDPRMHSCREDSDVLIDYI